jgi:RNA polymerase sigma-70 factor, ECF subfamily
LNATQLQLVVPPAFEAVFAEHGRLVWRLLVRLGVQARDAQDVCQEVFIVVHRRLPDFDPGRGSLVSWLYGICLRAASDYRRRHPNRRESPEQALVNVEARERPDRELEARRAWDKLARVLDTLDAPQRQVFVLYELEGLGMNEIATLLGSPVQTAYARLHSARRRILGAFTSEGTT